eukprot:scaffold589_cov343-Prasinococcus_capsulatus_cf.AAC.10
MLLPQDPVARAQAWKPDAKTVLLVYSKYALDLFATLREVMRAKKAAWTHSPTYFKAPAYFVSPAFTSNVEDIYAELRSRLRDADRSPEEATVEDEEEEGAAPEEEELPSEGYGDEHNLAAGDASATGMSEDVMTIGSLEAVTYRRRLQTAEPQAAPFAAGSALLGANVSTQAEPRCERDTPPELIAVLFAMQVCDTVDVYGLHGSGGSNSTSSGSRGRNSGGPYWADSSVAGFIAELEFPPLRPVRSVGMDEDEARAVDDFDYVGAMLQMLEAQGHLALRTRPLVSKDGATTGICEWKADGPESQQRRRTAAGAYRQSQSTAISKVLRRMMYRT